MVSVMKYVYLWFDLLTKPDETVEKVRRGRYDMADGIISIGTLGAIVGVLCFVGSFFVKTYVSVANMFAICVLGIPLGAILALILGSAAFRVSSKIFRGKGNYERECGIFGIWFCSYIIAMAPFFVLMGLGMYSVYALNNPALYLLLMGIGALVSMPLMGIALGALYQMIANEEKATIPRAGMLLMFAYGMIFFIIMLFVAGFAAGTAIKGMMPGYP
jgi:MFS family permease